MMISVIMIRRSFSHLNLVLTGKLQKPLLCETAAGNVRMINDKEFNVRINDKSSCLSFLEPEDPIELWLYHFCI